VSQPAIRVEGLWKEYVIGGSSGSGMTFRESIVEGVKAPLRRLRRGEPAPGTEERFWALRDVSFTVEPGEVVGIIGRNGAGKSTLLKILTRITAPTRGRVEIRGRVASLLEVGTGFHQELTGRENIRLNGAILGMSGVEIARRFDEIVDFAGVEKFIDTPVKRYSSGMQMRLAFAVAAHLEPDILVVDEVLAVGDVEFQKKCMRQMSQLSGSGRTILFVSHNLGAIKQLCRTAVYLRDGKVELSGSVEQVANRYIVDTMKRRERAGTFEWLSHELDLAAITVGDGNVRSFDAPNFSITVRARAAATLIDLAILIQHDDGGRAATIDCRDATFPKTLAEGQCMTISGQVECLNLVEGSYTLAVYQRTYAAFNIAHDVGDLVVTESMEDQLHPPYRARDRGSLALKVRFDGDGRTITS
jgi:homopolymeric O-antigen transport system ATP-binding protein